MQRSLTLVAAATLLLASAGTASADANAILDRDMRVFLEWFPGVYDNQEQVYFEQRLEVPEDERHERIHHTFAPVDLPAFGENVFYVQQYINDDPAQIYRQRIYVFVPDYEENAIRLIIHIPSDAEALVDAHLDNSKLDGLTPEATRTLPGCDVFWKRQANQFVGFMKEGACTYMSERSGKRIIIKDDLVLTENEIWIADSATDEDGNWVFGNKAGIPHKNIKARRFECWMGVLERNGEDWTFASGLEIWDQGGTVWVQTDEDEPQEAGIRLRNVVWPTGNNRNSFVLYALRRGEERAVSYVWSAPDAERLALNLRWMQASCTYTPEPAENAIRPD